MALLHVELFDFLRAYSALMPPNNISFPAHLPPSTVHDFLVNSILLNPQYQAYPPSKQYQKSFWKWTIHQLENMLSSEDFEIDTRIFDHYMSLLPPSASPLGLQGQPGLTGVHMQTPPPSYITHFWKPPSMNPTSQTIGILDSTQYQTTTLLESRTTIENGTTGLRTWLASLVLSQYLILHPDLVNDKQILELGSGTGFLGIVVATLQQLSISCTTEFEATSGNASALWMTDIDENVLSRCRNNVQLPCNLSSSHPNLNYRLLDWSASLDPEMSRPLDSLLHDEIHADVILGADIVFDPTLIPALISVLCLALQCPHRDSQKVALIALTVRNEDTLAKFLDVAQKQSLEVEDLQVQLDGKMFHEMVDGGSDANNGVKIFRITMSEDD